MTAGRAGPAIFTFLCPCCGERHEGLPDLTYRAPRYWKDALAAQDPANNWLDSDLCVVEGRHFFIRCVLLVPIRGTEARLGWGVWVSQSEANFKDYAESFHDAPERATFGYFANRLPDYPDTRSLHTLAHWRRGRQRPLVEIEPSDHPLYRDWRDGITLERAVAFARPFLHPEP